MEESIPKKRHTNPPVALTSTCTASLDNKHHHETKGKRSKTNIITDLEEKQEENSLASHWIFCSPILEGKPENFLSKTISNLNHDCREPKIPLSLPEGNIEEFAKEKKKINKTIPTKKGEEEPVERGEGDQLRWVTQLAVGAVKKRV
ncbi:hypothetical protein V6N11_038411 [Hibiscus sabdariffa]|uniref:Uncharacterized protein n=1 Tax=Hibiscus sabdariffa TaxID=183260 RepID=A0ABR2SK80_9ROSI